MYGSGWHPRKARSALRVPAYWPQEALQRELCPRSLWLGCLRRGFNERERFRGDGGGTQSSGQRSRAATPLMSTLEEFHRLQERLTQVARLATVGEMAAGLAHQLNQPLAAVANYAQACNRLLAMPDPDIEEIRDALQQIAAQAVRAGDIIHRLRALARNDAPRREL